MPGIRENADLRSPSSSARTRGSQLSDFVRYFSAKAGHSFTDYFDFQDYAIRDFRLFWRTFLDWSQLAWDGLAEPVCVGDAVEHAAFFPGLSLNYAENL